MEAAARSSAGNRTRRLAGYVLYTVYLLAVVEISCRLLLSIPFIASRTAGTDFAWRRAWVRSHLLGVANKYGFDVYDPTKGWISKPNLRNLRVFGTKVLDTNARGFRGTTDYAYEKRPGTLRVVLLGDSFTFGEELSDDETYGHYLQSMLPGAEIINMGVHGYGHDQMLIFLEEEGVRYRPDVVVLGFVAADVRRNVLQFRDYAKPRFVLRGGTLDLTGTPVPRPEEVLRSYAVGPRILDVARILAERFTVVTRRHDGEAEALTARILERMVADVRAIGAVPIFVYLPAIDDVAAAAPETGGEAMLSRFCAANGGADCFTMRPDFKRAAATTSLFAPGGHYSRFANRTVAKALRRRLHRLARRRDH